MKLRGLIYKKLVKKPDPAMKKLYDETYKKERERQIRAQIERQERARHDRIVIRARRDAARASMSKGQRVGRGLISAGRAIGKRIEKFDNEKFNEFVTGVSTSKKKK